LPALYNFQSSSADHPINWILTDSQLLIIRLLELKLSIQMSMLKDCGWRWLQKRRKRVQPGAAAAGDGPGGFDSDFDSKRVPLKFLRSRTQANCTNRGGSLGC